MWFDIIIIFFSSYVSRKLHDFFKDYTMYSIAYNLWTNGKEENRPTVQFHIIETQWFYYSTKHTQFVFNLKPTKSQMTWNLCNERKKKKKNRIENFIYAVVYETPNRFYLLEICQ